MQKPVLGVTQGFPFAGSVSDGTGDSTFGVNPADQDFVTVSGLPSGPETGVQFPALWRNTIGGVVVKTVALGESAGSAPSNEEIEEIKEVQEAFIGEKVMVESLDANSKEIPFAVTEYADKVNEQHKKETGFEVDYISNIGRFELKGKTYYVVEIWLESDEGVAAILTPKGQKVTGYSFDDRGTKTWDLPPADPAKERQKKEQEQKIAETAAKIFTAEALGSEKLKDREVKFEELPPKVKEAIATYRRKEPDCYYYKVYKFTVSGKTFYAQFLRRDKDSPKAVVHLYDAESGNDIGDAYTKVGASGPLKFYMDIH